MVSLAQLHAQSSQQLHTCDYQTTQAMNLYDSPEQTGLSTQAVLGRYLRFSEGVTPSQTGTLLVRLREDHYPGWIKVADLENIDVATSAYHPPSVSADLIQARIPAVMDFAKQALTVPNTYLWGGTLGPNYDCSGLMQRAFGSQGIWLPRDSYQQHDFTQALTNPGQTPTDMLSVLQAGDLLFFGSPLKTDHVALYLGNGEYIHSSGTERGRNKIAIDRLDTSDTVRTTYYHRFRGAGRVTASYVPPS